MALEKPFQTVQYVPMLCRCWCVWRQKNLRAAKKMDASQIEINSRLWYFNQSELYLEHGNEWDDFLLHQKP